MKIDNTLIIFVLFLTLCACSEEKSGSTRQDTIRQQLQKLSLQRITSEKNGDLESLLSYYKDEAISMPEYQPTLTGIEEIEAYYKAIFQRQSIQTLENKIDEIIPFDSTVVEFGTFKKEYIDAEVDTLITLKGKYCNIWDIQSDGNLKLQGESFGFFHWIDDPQTLVADLEDMQPKKSQISLNQPVPIELMAYNALMEKYVKTRDGAARSEFYNMKGSRSMPFADTIKTGIEEIKPYLIEYSSRGNVTIDSVSIYTYHHQYLHKDVLEYYRFRVRWTVPGFSGKTEGKGIRIWKRQEDNSLRMYREIGTHNHIK